MSDISPPQPINDSGTAALIAAIETNCNRQGRIVEIGDGRKVAILQAGESVTHIKDELDRYLPKPERLDGTTFMDDLASFLNECERFKTPALSVYVHAVDPKSKPSIVAVFNDSLLGAPDFRDHRASYQPSASNEVRAWVNAGDRLMSQEMFAELIEERLLDVKLVDEADANMKPLLEAAAALKLQVGSPADLLEVSRGLQVNVSQGVKGKPNLHNGTTTFAFEESAQPTVTVPGAVILEIPFFEGATKVLILARLRYKVADQKITWRVLLHDLPRVYGEAVDDLCAEIRAAGHRVVLGQP